MITLKQAIALLDLEDNDFVFLCKHRHEMFTDVMSVAQMRKTLDLKKVWVKKIYPDHFVFDPDVNWEFIIRVKEEGRE